jgi:hypothetical protein
VTRSRLLLALAAAVATAASVGAVAGTASADYGPLAVYQVTLSFNCNNPTLCGPDLGGFWGWAVFNSDGTADAELTGCGHSVGGGGGGAIHFHVDADDWFVQNGDFWTSSEVDTYVGSDAHTEVITTPQDTGIPATPGHYSTSDVLGFKAPPGMAIQIQVTKIPNR